MPSTGTQDQFFDVWRPYQDPSAVEQQAALAANPNLSRGYQDPSEVEAQQRQQQEQQRAAARAAQRSSIEAGLPQGYMVVDMGGAFTPWNPSLQQYANNSGFYIIDNLGRGNTPELQQLASQTGATYVPQGQWEHVSYVPGESGGLIKGIASSAAGFAKGIAPFAARALAAYGGAQGLGALFGGAGAGAGAGAVDLGSFNTVGAPVANAGLGTPAGALGAGIQGAGAASNIFSDFGAAGNVPGAISGGGTGAAVDPFGGLTGPGTVFGGPAPTAGGAAGGALNVPGFTPLQSTSALSSLKNILDSGGSIDDWLRIAGAIGPALLGAISANQQAGSLSDLANRQWEIGAPSRARFEGSFAPGFSMEGEPGFLEGRNQAAKGILHGLSVAGNPADSPNAWQQSLRDLYSTYSYPALQDYRKTSAAAGGMAALTGGAPATQTQAIGAQGQVFGNIGAGVADIFNPPKTLAQQLLELRQGGF